MQYVMGVAIGEPEGSCPQAFTSISAPSKFHSFCSKLWGYFTIFTVYATVFVQIMAVFYLL